jgi:hypothetical protein
VGDGVAGASDDAAQGINTITPAYPNKATGLPSNWDMISMPQRDNDEFYRLVQLSPADREYSAITVDFEEAGMKVFSVERLQNPLLFERFQAEKAHMCKSRPPGKLYVSFLFQVP